MTHVREVVIKRASFGDVTRRGAEDIVLISVTLAMGSACAVTRLQS